MRGRRGYRWLGRVLAATVVRIHVEGLANLPDGPALLAANHLGHADPLLLLAVLPRQPEIVALDALRSELVGPLLRPYRPIFVRRDRPDRTPLQASLDALHRGAWLLLFPEGHISRSGGLELAQAGVAFLAMRARMPVVPIALTGSERIAEAWWQGRRACLSVTVGAPFFPERAPGESRRVARERITQQTMYQIASLLPSQYRGVYREAPSEPALH